MIPLLSRIVLGVIGVAVGITSVILLREATMSAHHRVSADSEAVVVVDATTKGGETGRTLEDMVRALLVTCRLEVGRSELISTDDDGGGRFTAVFRPGLDENNRRQLRGCLEDWVIDHVKVDVISISRP